MDFGRDFGRVLSSRIAGVVARLCAIVALSSAIIAQYAFFVCKIIKEIYGNRFCFSANNSRKKENKKSKIIIARFK